MSQYKKISWIFMLLLSVSITSCDVNANRGRRTGEEQFQTNDAAVLYFKNIRSLNYSLNRAPDTDLDIYVADLFNQKTKEPVIYPGIHHNWLQDEVYLVFKQKNISDTETIVIIDKHKQEQLRKMEWPADDDFTGHFQLGMELKAALQDESMLMIQNQSGDLTPLLTSSQSQNKFLTTIRDFVRLTSKK